MQIQSVDTSNNLMQQLDQAVRPVETATAAFSQMLMSLRWASAPEEIIRMAATLNEESSWRMLCLAEKVSAFYRSKGIEASCRELPALNASPTMVARLKQYQHEVCSLTNGVLHSKKLTRYFTLRTMLLADAARLVAAENPICESLFHRLNSLFICIDGHLTGDTALFLPEICASLRECMDIAEAYKKALSTSSDLVNKSRIARIDNMLKIMKLFQEAIQNPFCVFPLLLAPIQSQATIDEAAEQEIHIDLRATGWLDAYLEVSDFQMRSYLERNHPHLSVNERIQQRSQEAFVLVKEIHNQLRSGIKEIHAFLALPGDMQRKRLGQFNGTLTKCTNCAKSLEKLAESIMFMRELLRAKNPPEKALDLQLVIFPSYFHHIFLEDLTKGLNEVKNQISALHDQLPTLLPEEFKGMDSPYVTCLDLLDFRNRMAFAQLTKKGFATSDDPSVQKMIAEFRKLLQSLFIKSSLQFLALRTYYSCPTTPDDGFDMASELSRLSQDIAIPVLDSKMLAIFKNPKTEPSIKYLVALGAFIKRLCTIRHWHGMMKTSPVAAKQQTEPMERRFFHELYKLLYLTLTESDGDFLFKTLENQIEGTWMKSQAALYPISKKALAEIKTFFREFQNELKQKPVPSLKKFEAQAFEVVLFIAKKMELMDQKCDALFQALMDHLQMHPEQEESVDKFSIVLKVAKEVWDPLILDSSNGLVRYLQAATCMEESKTAAKQKIVPSSKPPSHTVVKTEPPAASIPEKPVAAIESLPDNIPDLVKAVEERCAKLAGCYMGFTTLTNKAEVQFANQFSAANARNLLDATISLKELSAHVQRYGAYPAFTAELYLRLAIMMEQTLKLKASGIGLALPDEDSKPLLLSKTGKECLWQTHSPLRIYQAIYQSLKQNFLSSEQEEVLNKLERVIAISSRYPATGNDALMRHEDLQVQDGGRKSQQLLQASLSTALHLLRSIPADEKAEPFKICLDTQKIEEALSITSKQENHPFPSVRTILNRLQLLRLAPQNRKVMPVAHDLNASQRSETIQAALADLSLIMHLCQDLLEMPEDPGICLTLGHSLLRYESVALESALLILLSHLPITSPGNSSLHYLWDASPPKRFSHRIDQFARQLAGGESLCRRSQELTGYLKTSYRYPSEEPFPIISKLSTLSVLWEKLLTGTLSDAESQAMDRMLHIQNPDEREVRLADHIAKTIQLEIKQPFIQTMALVADLLTSYEKILIQVGSKTLSPYT